MTNFTISVAGQAVAIHAIHDSTRDYCKDYLTEEPADLSVAISQSDIDFERAKSARENALEGLPVHNHSDAYLETLSVQRKITELLFSCDTLLFHGSVIAVDGVGYLFTAKSGTGKSTHTRLWRELFGSRAVMVNDDKPFLRIREDGVTVYGTPWMGKHGLGANIAVPLKAICVLNRGTENQIQQIPPKDVLQILLQQSCRPQDPKAIPKYLDLIDALASKTTFYSLHCNMNPDAAKVAYEGMQ